jgi:hypothetical protein
MNTEIDAQSLKALGIMLKSTSLLEAAYERYRAIPLLPLTTNMQVLVLDLDNLPVKPIPFKEVFLRWMMQANEGRMINGEEPIMTYELARMCPIWKVISMPVKSLAMTRDKVMKPPKIQTARQQARPGSINKASSKKRK